MSRWVPTLILAGGLALSAQEPPKPPDPPPAAKDQPELKRRGQPSGKKPTKDLAPPEEDKATATTDYSFNPLQAKKDITVGNLYFKKGSYRAAAGRFSEATKWNEGDTEAWLRLGETEEKLKDHKAAHDAYAKYLELAPDAKNVAEIQKKVAKLK
jgi:tetratricopeptide (TPR) repeat protein